MPSHPDPPTAPTSNSSLALAVAWISTALVPVAIIIGRSASMAFLDSQGYPQPVSTEPPGLGLAAFGLIAAIVLIPTATAVWFGLAAARTGRRSGLTAASVAGVIGGGLVLLGLPLFLSRLIGWPLVLVIGTAIAAVTGVVAQRARRASRDNSQP